MRTLSTVSALPTSFQDALKAGWMVVKEESTITGDESQRSGVVLLAKKGQPARLRIAYTATAQSWSFEKPQPIEETLAA